MKILGESLHRLGTVVYNHIEGRDTDTQVVATAVDRTIVVVTYDTKNDVMKYCPSLYRDGLINIYWSEINTKFYYMSMAQGKGNEWISELKEIPEHMIKKMFGKTFLEITGARRWQN